MKAQTKALVVSVVVIALALTAVSGITYSWFSDTETSTIDVSTAKIDIEGAYNPSLVSVKGVGGVDVTDTVASIASDNKNLTVSSLLSHRTITAEYTLKNLSTVDTIYRMYISVEGIADGLAQSMISVSGSIGSAPASSLTFTNGIAYVFGSGTSGVSLAKAVAGTPGTYLFTIKIDSTDLTSSVGTFQIKIVNEAYQSDYTYTEAKVISKTGTASLPTTSVTGDVTFKGTVPAAAGTAAQPAESEIVFSAGAMNAATASGANPTTLKTKMLEPTGSIAKIELILDGAATTDFGSDYVTVSLSIPGHYTGLDVVYDGGAGDAPIVLGCDYDSSKNVTVVTFKTNHFSEFSVRSGATSTATVFDMNSLITALGADVPNIKLGANIEYIMPDTRESRIYVGNNTMQNLDLNGHKLVVLSSAEDTAQNYALFFVDGNFTIGGNGTFSTAKDAEDASNSMYGFSVLARGHLTIDGGKYRCGGTIVQITSDVAKNPEVISMDCTCDIDGGEFTVAPFDGSYGKKYMLNYVDAVYKEALKQSKKLMTVYGGTFEGYDPSNSASESPVSNMLAEGYIVTESSNTYAVSVAPLQVKQGAVSKYFASLDDAIKYIAGLSGSENIEVNVLASGNYIWTENINGAYTGSVAFRVLSGLDVKFDMSNVTQKGSDGYAIYVEGKNLSFDNIGFIYSFNNYNSFARPGILQYNNCTFTGKYCATGDARFSNCIFDSGNTYNYLVQVYNGKATFGKCVFNTVGKAVLIYFESGHLEAEFNGCTFNDVVGTQDKAAIEIHTECGTTPNNITCSIVIKDSSASGFCKGSFSGSNLWSAVNNFYPTTESGTTTVTENGVVVLQPSTDE